MPQGDKSSYTAKQKRQARHIEESEERRGRSTRTAGRIAWATVNKQDGGGKKRGSGRSPRGRRAASPRPARTRTRTTSARRTRTVRSRP